MRGVCVAGLIAAVPAKRSARGDKKLMERGGLTTPVRWKTQTNSLAAYSRPKSTCA